MAPHRKPDDADVGRAGAALEPVESFGDDTPPVLAAAVGSQRNGYLVGAGSATLEHVGSDDHEALVGEVIAHAAHTTGESEVGVKEEHAGTRTLCGEGLVGAGR